MKFISYHFVEALLTLGYQHPSPTFTKKIQTMHSDALASESDVTLMDVLEFFENEYQLEGIVKSFKEGGAITWLYSVQPLGQVSSYKIENQTKREAWVKCLSALFWKAMDIQEKRNIPVKK